MLRARQSIMSRSSVVALLNHLNGIVNSLNELAYLKNDKEIYVALHNIFYYIMTKHALTTSKYIIDPRLQGFMGKVIEFLRYVQQLYSRYIASTDIIVAEMYRFAREKLRVEEASKRMHVFACDALSIVDALFIAHKLRPKFFGIIINPSGKTAAYKFLLDPKRFVEEEGNITLMNAVSKALNVSINISKFDDIDRFIHGNENANFNDASTVIDQLYNIVSSFYTKVKQLDTHNIVTVVVSDHGYDIERVLNGYRLKHGLSPNALSILAPILII
jgi:hypothetical protein